MKPIITFVLFLSLPAWLMSETKTATFAGGCYWCMEEVFDRLEGVSSATSGFANGVEAVEVTYRPEEISYEQLLDIYWHNIDPLDPNGQFCDRGAKYRSAIFFQDEVQKAAAMQSKSKMEGLLNQKFVTEIEPIASFSPAKDQDYYKTNPIQFHQYKLHCKRKNRLQELWGKSAG